MPASPASPPSPDPQPPSPGFLAHFSHSWLDFRLPELLSLAHTHSVHLSLSPHHLKDFERPNSPLVFLPLHSPQGTDGLRRLAARAVLLRRVVQLWASAHSFVQLERQLQAAAAHQEHKAYLAEDVTFKIVVESFGRGLTDEQRLALIDRVLRSVPFRGKVRMKNPQYVFVLLVDNCAEDEVVGASRRSDEPDAAAPAESARDNPFGCRRARRFYFGREVAVGRRDLVTKYDLKRRNYIGTTSLDAELSLVMGNLAAVRPGDLVLDPYCGTAGCLIGAAHFGARVVGADIYGPALRGQLRTRSGPSKKSQAQRQGIDITFAEYGLPPPIGLVHGDTSRSGCCFHMSSPPDSEGSLSQAKAPARRPMFEAIVCDPPYGIRERSASLDDPSLSSRTLDESMLATHVPRTALVSLDTIFADLFSLATHSLVDNGRLVFLLPCTLPIAESLALLPPHPALELISACEQRMAARWSRWCITMRRVPDGAWAAASGPPDGSGDASPGEDALPSVRGTIFECTRKAMSMGPPKAPVLHPSLFEKVARRRASCAKHAAEWRLAQSRGLPVDVSINALGSHIVRLTVRAK